MSKSSRLAAIKRDNEDVKANRIYGSGRDIWDQTVLDRIGVRAWTCAEGDHFIRVLPPIEEGFFGIRVYVHFNVGPNKDAFVCPRKMHNLPCPVCERGDEIEKAAGENVNWDDIKPFRPQVKYVFWIVDMQDEKETAKGVQVYMAPITVRKLITRASEDPRTKETIDISDPDTGRVFQFCRSGSSQFGTSYEAAQSLLGETQPMLAGWKKIVEECHLMETVKVYSYEEIKAAFSGMPQDEGEESTPTTKDEDTPWDGDEKPAEEPAEEPKKPESGDKPKEEAAEPEVSREDRVAAIRARVRSKLSK